MPAVAFHTLGCKVNHYETEAIWQLFKEAGYERTDFESVSDVYVINTCTVTNTGDKKSRQVIRRAIRKNPDAVICVTGCYAQTSPAEIMAIPGVDIVVGTQDRVKMLEYIEQYKQERQPINTGDSSELDLDIDAKVKCRWLLALVSALPVTCNYQSGVSALRLLACRA